MKITVPKLYIPTGALFSNINIPLFLNNKVFPLFLLILFFLVLGGLLLWTPAAFAYSNWSDGCQNCHGGFKSGNYTSKTTDDPVNWSQNLMDGHVSQFNLGCSDCHSGGSFKPVPLSASNSGITCTSCHGRSEDDAGAGLSGTMPSAGLRQIHYNSGVQVCAGCHAADSNPAAFTPVGENLPSPTFIAKGIDPCNDTAFGSVGLDNDGDGSRDSADTDCQAPVDKPPTVVISAPASGLVGDLLTFDGSGSSDDGTIISYTWAFGDGIGASGMTTTHAYGSAGTYTVILEVCDNASTSQCTTASHTVTINDTVVDNPPIAVITGPNGGNVGDNLSFDGSASTDDGAIVSYAWTVDGVAAGGNMSLSWLFSAAGSFNVVLTVCDNATSSQCGTATHVVTISDVTVDNPPVAVISGPSSGVVGDTLNFDGSGSTDDSAIVSYEWMVGGVAVGSKMTLSWPFNIAGSFSVTLTVCDDTAQCNTASHGVSIRQQAAGGEALYMNNCASCHGNPTTSEPPPNASIKVAGTRVCSVQGAIYGTSQYPNGVETMRFMQGMFSDDQIQEIADYLNSFPITGMQRYTSACSGCHAQNVDEDIRGSDAKDIKEAIHDEREMRFLDCLPDGDIDQIGLYLRADDDDHGEDKDKDDDKDDGGEKDKKDDKDKDDHKKHDGDREHRKSYD